MACCHHLASFDNQLIGDSLEIEMFNATGSKINFNVEKALFEVQI
jgi:hypothetical protein